MEDRTVGRVFGGKYRPSTFLTLTLDSYGRVDSNGAAVDPDSYDYRRAARDAIHFPKLVDRFWQNTRRCVGWDVQYFGTVEPQKRGAPHFHAAIRGTIPRAELRAITAATYHQVWWPSHDEIVYSGERLPRWDNHHKAFVDPDTRDPLPTWEEATDPDRLTVPAHNRHLRATGARQGDPGRHRGSRAPHRLPDQVPHQERRAGRRTRRDRHRPAARARPPPGRRTRSHAVRAALPDLAALRGRAQGRPTVHGAGAVPGQGAQARTPRHRRTPRPGLAQVVEQEPVRPPGRADRVRSATAPPGRGPARLRRR